MLYVVGCHFSDDEANVHFAHYAVEADTPEEAMFLGWRDAAEMIWEGTPVLVSDVAPLPDHEHLDAVAAKYRVWEPKGASNLSALRPEGRAFAEVSSERQAELLAEPIGSIPLPTLRDVDWSRLSHSYGAAEQVPRYLVGLGADVPSWRRRSLTFLTALLDHQSESGAVFEACLPFLLTILGAWMKREWEYQELAEHLAYEAESAVRVPESVTRQKGQRRKSLLGEGLLSVEELVREEVENREAVRRGFVERLGEIRYLSRQATGGTRQHLEEVMGYVESGFARRSDWGA